MYLAASANHSALMVVFQPPGPAVTQLVGPGVWSEIEGVAFNEDDEPDAGPDDGDQDVAPAGQGAGDAGPAVAMKCPVAQQTATSARNTGT